VRADLAPRKRRPPQQAPLAFAYYIPVALAIYAYERVAHRYRLPKDATFLCLFIVLVALPTVLFKQIGAVAFLAIGWQIVLSTFSYCVDARSFGRTPTLREYLFFVFVDPSLVFPLRARRSSEPVPFYSALGRLSLGVCCMTLGRTALLTLPALVEAANSVGVIYVEAASAGTAYLVADETERNLVSTGTMSADIAKRLRAAMEKYFPKRWAPATSRSFRSRTALVRSFRI
jgi:hypothetical protein